MRPAISSIHQVRPLSSLPATSTWNEPVHIGHTSAIAFFHVDLHQAVVQQFHRFGCAGCESRVFPRSSSPDEWDLCRWLDRFQGSNSSIRSSIGCGFLPDCPVPGYSPAPMNWLMS